MDARCGEGGSILILNENIYTCFALECMAGGLAGSDSVKSFHRSCDFLRSLSVYENVKAVIISYDIGCFDTIEILTLSFHEMKLVVIVSRVSAALVKLLQSIGVTIIISEYDNVSLLENALACTQGEVYLSPILASQVEKNDALHEHGREKLTCMERYVVNRFLSGVELSEIADEKSLSIKTVTTHKNKAFKKIGVSRLADFFKKIA